MSILNGIMNLCGKTVKFTKSGAVKTADVLAKKVDLCFDAAGLLKSPAADEFIASAGKQKAKILSDNIVRFADNTIPYRVITKYLPSGTTITKAYDVGGIQLKEVIKKNGSAYTYSSGKGIINKEIFVKKDYKTGEILYKPLYLPASGVKYYTPHGLRFTKQAIGMTEFSNKNNADYQALKNMGLIG